MCLCPADKFGCFDRCGTLGPLGAPDTEVSVTEARDCGQHMQVINSFLLLRFLDLQHQQNKTIWWVSGQEDPQCPHYTVIAHLLGGVLITHKQQGLSIIGLCFRHPPCSPGSCPSTISLPGLPHSSDSSIRHHPPFSASLLFLTSEPLLMLFPLPGEPSL